MHEHCTVADAHAHAHASTVALLVCGTVLAAASASSCAVAMVISRAKTSCCRVSFDGKNVHRLDPNDSVRMHTAQWPLPMITAETMDKDWYTSITEKLNWNNTIKKTERSRATRQLPFPAACRLCAPLWCCICCWAQDRFARWNCLHRQLTPVSAMSPTCCAHVLLIRCCRSQFSASLQLYCLLRTLPSID